MSCASYVPGKSYNPLPNLAKETLLFLFTDEKIKVQGGNLPKVTLPESDRASIVSQWSWAAAADVVWQLEPKIFTACSLTEKVYQPLA